jgi:hypothetical protein
MEQCTIGCDYRRLSRLGVAGPCTRCVVANCPCQLTFSRDRVTRPVEPRVLVFDLLWLRQLGPFSVIRFDDTIITLSLLSTLNTL